MRWKVILLFVMAASLTACRTIPPQPTVSSEAGDLEAIQKRAADFNSVITVPWFETTPREIRDTVTNTIRRGNAGLDRIGRLGAQQVTFGNTVRALDDIGFQIAVSANRLSLIKETSTSAGMREAAVDAMKVLQDWMVGLDYREDVYRAVRAYAARQSALSGEEAKLLSDTLRDYRRAGLELPRGERDQVERLRKELSGLETDFESNINKAEKALKFGKSDLEGVPEDFLNRVQSAPGEYTVMANITWHYLTVMENAKLEQTRMIFERERSNLAREQNIPLLEKILPLRDDIAHRLGYRSWADYATETRMAKNAATAVDFLERLKTGLRPKFDAEVAEFHRLKAEEAGDPDAKIHLWDWRYYANQYKKQKYSVNAEELRVYFPYENVLQGMFDIYQTIFTLKFERLEAPYKWIDDLELYAVTDARSGQPLGLFYLDMFPREGKYHHFAQFEIIGGKLLPNGNYQRPTVALICNFPSPTKDRPSLMSHAEVETLFHEFGHAMHSILTRAHYVRFAGTSVPRDFVEAPSQMLENWVWDKQVLDSFAADYRDPSKKIPEEILSKLKEARLSTEGTRYTRQLSFGLMDMTLHRQITRSNATETLPLSNEVLGEVFFPMIPDTAFVAYFGHIIGYGASYYGYAWADAIAADMATVFENSPNGYLDEQAGMRLRREIYEPGDSREVNESIKRFLGRERSIEPFLKKVGIGKANGDAATR